MPLYKRPVSFVGLVLFMAGLLAACQSTPQFATSSPSGIGVGITDDLCPNVIVKVGQQITWANQGAREHIVRDITVEGKSQFDSGSLQSGDIFALTFSEPQTYKYQCSADGSLIGTITVSAKPAPSADLVQAREVLQAYFDLLHDGRYAEAASYYGGNYEILWEWNPTVAHDDHATLLENGCKVNGLQCLAIKDIAGEEEISSGEYLFTVEFLSGDGGTFVSEPSIKQFSYTVKKVDEQFLVQELPIYVP